MTHKIFIDRQKHFKTIKTSNMFGVGSLAILIIINMITHEIMGLMAVSFLLGGAVLIWLISLWKTVFLLNLPVILIDDNSIRYFNIFWYNHYRWNEIEIASYSRESSTISLGLLNGRIFERLSLESLDEKSINEIKKLLVLRNKMKS